jgi:YVTN family beta-propeller protein
VVPVQPGLQMPAIPSRYRQLAHVVALAIVLALPGAGSEPAPVRSPFDLAFSPDGRRLAITDQTADLLYIMDVEARRVEKTIPVARRPSGLAWADADHVLVAEYGSGTLAEVDVVAARITRRIEIGPTPLGVDVARGSRRAIVTCFGLRDVAVVDLDAGRVIHRLRAAGMPYFVRVAPDEKTAVVGNLLAAPFPDFGISVGQVTLLDLERLRASPVRLPYGSSNVRGVAISPDSRFAYVAHTRGYVDRPTTHLDEGWATTNVVSLIDLATARRTTTVLLDGPLEGAADPWGVAVSPDGEMLWVTCAGTGELARIDLARLHQALNGQAFAESASWTRARQNPLLVESDLTLLPGSGLLERILIPAEGPRGLAVSPDGETLAMAGHFSGTVVFATPELREVVAVPLGPNAEPDAARRGEIVFHDARRTKGKWLSCATCHPDGRSDGMYWDLLNDGAGNPKKTKSLVNAHLTPPSMSTGVRSGYEVAVPAGFRHIEFNDGTPQEIEDVMAYIRSLDPETSPYRSGVELSALARRGEALFFDLEVGCVACHPPPLFTDLQMYDVGTRTDADRHDLFDTPSLLELWRTGPYLHHSYATSVRAVVTIFNRRDRHGKTSHLSSADIRALSQYLLEL